MKKIGYALIAVSFAIGIASEHLPFAIPVMPFVALAFGYFLLGIYVLILDRNETTRT